MFGAICKQIKIYMKEILKLKTEKPEQVIWITIRFCQGALGLPQSIPRVLLTS